MAKSKLEVKKEFGIPGFAGADSSLGQTADELAKGYLDYSSGLKSQLYKAGVRGGGYVGAIRDLGDWTRTQAGLLQSAKQFGDIRNKITDLSSTYQTKLQEYLGAKEEMQHRVGLIGGREESAAKMRNNENELNVLKSQIDQLTREAEGYAANPFIGQQASGMAGVRAGAEQAWGQAQQTNFGDIQDTIARIGGGLLLGPALGALGVESTTAGSLAALAPAKDAVGEMAKAYMEFTGTHPVQDISNAIMSGTPIEEAITQAVQRGASMQMFNRLKGDLQLQEVTRNEKGEIVTKYGKEKLLGENISGLPVFGTEKFPAGDMVGSPYDTKAAIDKATQPAGAVKMPVNYGGHIKWVFAKETSVGARGKTLTEVQQAKQMADLAGAQARNINLEIEGKLKTMKLAETAEKDVLEKQKMMDAAGIYAQKKLAEWKKEPKNKGKILSAAEQELLQQTAANWHIENALGLSPGPLTGEIGKRWGSTWKWGYKSNALGDAPLGAINGQTYEKADGTRALVYNGKMYKVKGSK